MKPYAERLYNGIVKENPVFVLMLGMCPTLAVTTSAINGLGMGLSSLVVLAISNLSSLCCATSSPMMSGCLPSSSSWLPSSPLWSC